MKKLFALLIAVIMIFTLSACGGGEEKPNTSGNMDNPSTSQTDTEGNKGSENTNTPAPGETIIETKSDRVISTMNDGAGNLAVTEYIYKDGTLSEIIMTMQCADAASAKTLYDSYATGDLKEYGKQLYSDIKQDGKNVVCTYQDSQLASFSGFNMEQLAEMLQGGDPFAGGNMNGNPNEEVGELTINILWGDMNLPDGFPKLAEGVTNYIEVEGGAMLSWNAMTLADLETMIEKLEDWSGLSIEKTFEADGAAAWSAENEKMVITVNYWPDAIDMQVGISIQKF